jgi:hypothetical protein
MSLGTKETATMPIPGIPGVPGELSTVDPGIDGQKRWYMDPSLDLASINKFCVYINGIRVRPSEHRSTAEQLSRMGPMLVLGVFNESNFIGTTQLIHYLRGVRDAPRSSATAVSVPITSLADFARGLGGLAGAGVVAIEEELRRQIAVLMLQRLEVGGVMSSTVDLGQCIGGFASILGAYLALPGFRTAVLNLIVNFMRSHDHAAHSMYKLIGNYPWRLGRLVIVSHSQGNLCTALALWAHQLLRELNGERMYSNIDIFALAPPVPAWPSAPRVHVYYHLRDPIAPLGAGGDLFTADDTHISNPADAGGLAGPHDTGLYLGNAEFERQLRATLGL